jgi:hypothetical protein
VPELDLATLSRHGVRDRGGRRHHDKKGNDQDHCKDTAHEQYCAHTASWDGTAHKTVFPAKSKK